MRARIACCARGLKRERFASARSMRGGGRRWPRHACRPMSCRRTDLAERGPPMKIDLSGNTALVTGSTAGIGHAIARGLAAAGASVVVNGRKPDGVAAAVKALRTQVPDAVVEGVAADVATDAGCAALIKAVPSPD